MSEGAKKLAVL